MAFKPGKNKEDVLFETRRPEAQRLRADGMSFFQIGIELDCSISTAHKLARDIPRGPNRRHGHGHRVVRRNPSSMEANL